MGISDLGYASIYILTGFSYLIFRFGMISRGNSKEYIEFFGGLLLLISFVLMFIFFGLKSTVVLIVVFIVIITPSGELLLNNISKKLNYPIHKK